MTWNIIGHEHIVSWLQQQIDNETLAHTYLFEGPKGIGKTTVAKEFAKRILKTNQNLESHPDFLYIKKMEKKKEISVKDVRNVIHMLHITSSTEHGKVVIIDNSENLSLSASNALLKTLEEPMVNSVVILITENKTRIPKTIISRSRIVKLKLVSRSAVYDYLEKNKFSYSTARAYTHAAMGRPAVLKAFLDSKNNWKLHNEKIREALEIINISPISRLSMKKEKMTPSQVRDKSNDLQSVIRDVILMKSGNSDTIQFDDIKGEIRILSKKAEIYEWADSLKRIIKFTRNLELNASPQVVYENILLSIP